MVPSVIEAFSDLMKHVSVSYTHKPYIYIIPHPATPPPNLRPTRFQQFRSNNDTEQLSNSVMFSEQT